MIDVAPSEASPSPVTKEMRRPRDAASRASISDDNAAPNVDAVVTEPAHASDPASLTAISDPTETTEPAARPLRICAVDNSAIVRRCRAAVDGLSKASAAVCSVTEDMARQYRMYPMGV